MDHLTELRLFDLKVKGSHVETIRNADASLGEAFAADARVLDGDVELEVVLKPSKESRQGALSRLRGAPKTLARDRELRENAQRFQHDGTGRVEIIDLLHDQLISRKQVLRIGARSRAIKADSAFEAISAAHDELGEYLRRAASLA